MRPINQKARAVMDTPWGPAESIRPVTGGILIIGTGTHGGYRLTKKKNRAVPDQWRVPDGWYEEDCGWAPLAITFPEAFPDVDQEHARRVVGKWEEWLRWQRTGGEVVI
jgi:hypothetical protein